MQDLANKVSAALDDDSHEAAIQAAIADEDAKAQAAATARAMGPIDAVRQALAQSLEAAFGRFAERVLAYDLGNSFYVTKVGGRFAVGDLRWAILRGLLLRGVVGCGWGCGG